jgi:hypothetical protein
MCEWQYGWFAIGKQSNNRFAAVYFLMFCTVPYITVTAGALPESLLSLSALSSFKSLVLRNMNISGMFRFYIALNMMFYIVV